MQFDKVLEKDSVKSLFSPKETLGCGHGAS
jgi:hypothetical protein